MFKRRRASAAQRTPVPPECEYSLISLDLLNEQMAIDLAGKLATQTGFAVAVQDADGAVIITVSAPTKN